MYVLASWEQLPTDVGSSEAVSVGEETFERKGATHNTPRPPCSSGTPGDPTRPPKAPPGTPWPSADGDGTVWGSRRKPDPHRVTTEENDMRENDFSSIHSDLPSDPPSTAVGTDPINVLRSKPGWKTVEAHMALIFTLVAGIAALLGYNKVTPDRLQSGYESLVTLLTSIGPLIGAAVVVVKLITSRGKFESNKVKATAAVQLGHDNPMMMQGIGGADILGALLGGKPKDPGTYIELGKRVGTSGVIPGKAGEIVGQILGGGKNAPIDPRILAGFENLGERLTRVEDALAALAEEKKEGQSRR